MTQPAQYITGRTVQEQIRQLIAYVDTRAAEVATDAIAGDMARLDQAVDDAEAARDAAIGAVNGCVKLAPSGVQQITSYKLVVDQGIDADVTGNVTGNLTGNADTATEATKIGSSSVGSDLKPIKIVSGVPTAVTNDLVDTASAQTVGGAKTFSAAATLNDVAYFKNNFIHSGAYRWHYQYVQNTTINSTKQFAQVGLNDSNVATMYLGPDNTSKMQLGEGAPPKLVTALTASAPSLAVATVGYVADTGGTLNNLVHTTGNETVNGIKQNNTSRGWASKVGNYGTGLNLISPTDDYSTASGSEIAYPYVAFEDSNGNQSAILRFIHNGSNKYLQFLIKDKDGVFHTTTLATYTDS